MAKRERREARDSKFDLGYLIIDLAKEIKLGGNVHTVKSRTGEMD